MNKDSKILILGGRGLVGSAIKRELERTGHKSVLTPFREELDLLSQSETQEYFAKNKPEYVFLAAAKVGGILANNTYRADFIHQNLIIQNNVFDAAHSHNVSKLLFLGSSCIYPKECPQPIKEEYLLTGPLEITNEPYAIAKIAGLKTAESFRKQYGCNYISVMPTNLYGVNDNFHLENSHVIPGLIARMSIAMKNEDPIFQVWGTGNPRREFLYVDDMAKACIHVMNHQGEDLPDLINIGTGEDISIKELVLIIKEELGYQGTLEFDTSKPDGTMKKLLNVDRLHSLGWKHETSLRDGIKKSIQFYRDNY